MRRGLLSVLLCFISFLGIDAGNGIEIDISHITARNGLPANSVRCIYQDSRGFLWIGTINNGLCKYDGRDFKVIYPSYGNGPGLADPRINSIVEDAYGHLWIVTMSEQVSCYDLKQEKFVDYSGSGHYEDHYGHVAFCQDGIWLWGSSSGCMHIRYDCGNFTSERYTTESGLLPSDDISFIMEDDDATWIGTHKGLCRLQNGLIEHVVPGATFVAGHRTADEHHFISAGGDVWKSVGSSISHVARIDDIQDSHALITGTFSPDDRTWMIFTTTHTYAYDIHTASVTRVKGVYDLPGAEVLGDGKGNWLVYDKHGNVVLADTRNSWQKRMKLAVGGGDALWTVRYGFVRTEDDMVWITTHENGLFSYDIATDSLRRFSMDGAGSGNASDILMCVVEDDSGNLWVGSEFSGIFKINVINHGASYLHFKDKAGTEYSDMVRMISTHAEDEVWVSTRDGYIYVYDGALQSLKKKFSYGSSVYAVCVDDLSQLWVGTRGRGLVVDGRRYRHVDGDPRSLSSDKVFGMLKDRSGDMWIGTFGGGVNLALKDGKGGYVFKSFFNDSYSRRHVRALCLDAAGYLWVGSSNGVVVFNPEELKANPSRYMSFNSLNHKLRSNECRSIKVDSKGRVYVAETGAGFSVCEPKDYSALEFTHYGPNDGLVSGLVQGFVEDEYGRMWITTEYGISCFDPRSGEFCNFMFSNNMQGNVCLDNSAARLDDGRLLVGTNAGMLVINPDEVSAKAQNRVKDVVFTSLQVHGRETGPGGGDSPVGSSISYASEIRLKYSQNTFSLSFSTLDYAPGVLYSYILEGYDRQWSPASEMNEALYRQLPPGNYSFKVRARNHMGQWQDTPTCVNVFVSPPFYRTTAAYLIYFLLTLVALHLAYRLVSRMNKLKNDAEVERQLTEYKLVFFTNVSHEFRTPLTMILHSLEKLRRCQDPDDVNSSSAVRTMTVGANRLMMLVNQLLEFRKIQNDRHTLRLEQTDIVRFCGEIFENFKESARAKKQDFHYVYSEPEYTMYLDRGDMDKILYNLISNAIKYTPEGGRVTLSVEVSEMDRQVRILVKDNGVGIPEDRRRNIFVRFSPGEASESSMGIGLHLTKSLVDANKGEIFFSENPGGGTIMTVILPTDTTIYSPDDFKPEDVPQEDDHSLRRDVIDVGSIADISRPVKPINPHRILVVDDEPDIRSLIVDELKEYFNIVQASDGTAALNTLRQDDSIELVVCDVMMPGMSGYDVTAAIKEDINTCHIPVILLTALNSDAKKLEGIRCGADAYITKPFSPDYILIRILKLLEQRNKLREKFSNDLSIKAESICTNDMDREFMDKVDKILEKQLNNPDFSMDDFASEMAMGRSSFYNKVHKVTGYSPNRYIRILRMKKAAELILTGKYTAAEVAYKVGIQDASYFSKSFREQFGISPKAYYRQAFEGRGTSEVQDQGSSSVD